MRFVIGLVLMVEGSVLGFRAVVRKVDASIWADEGRYYSGTTKQEFSNSVYRCRKGKVVELECVIADMDKRHR